MKKVVIIGGGITGLAAAWHLHQARKNGEPIDYLLVEKDNKWGGKIVTDNVNGFVIEGGPDCFMSEKPAAFQLTSQLGIDDCLLPSNESSAGTFIFSKGRLQKLPDGLMLLVPNKIWPFVTSSLISWPGKMRMAFDLIIPKKKDDTDETLGGFVSRRMGKEVLEKIAEPMIGGIHGGDPDTMSLKASFPRFLKMEQDHGSLAIAMLAARRKMAQMKKKALANPTPGVKPKSYFMSYNKGMSQLTDAVVKRLDQDKIFINREVTAIEQMVIGGQNKYIIQISGMEPVEADAVIMAAPAGNVANLFEDIDPKIAANLRRIPMSSSACISLAYKKSDIPQDKITGFGFVIPYAEGRDINAVTFTSLKWNNRVPDNEHILIRSFVGKPKKQGPALLNEGEIENLVRAELDEILGIKAKPVAVKVHKWTNARPQYVIGHLERMKEVDQKLAEEHPGLYLAGASYHGIGVPDCISDGFKAGEAACTYVKGEKLGHAVSM